MDHSGLEAKNLLQNLIVMTLSPTRLARLPKGYIPHASESSRIIPTEPVWHFSYCVVSWPVVPVSFSEAVGWPATCFTTRPLVPLGTSYCLSLSASSMKGGWPLSMWRSNCGLWWGFSELTSVISYCRARCWVSSHKGCWAGRRTLPSWTSWGNLAGKRPGPDCPRLYARLATRVFLINESLR